MRTLVITLNHLPAPDLNPNRMRSLHWSRRSAAERVVREEAGWEAHEHWQGAEPMARARISYEFTVKTRRKRDLDNLLAACKPYCDGIIDAGVIAGDDIEHLEYGRVAAVYGGKDQTQITVEEV